MLILPMRGHLDKIRRSLDMSNSATPVIENSEPNFRKGSEAEIQTAKHRLRPLRRHLSVRRAEINVSGSSARQRGGDARKR